MSVFSIHQKIPVRSRSKQTVQFTNRAGHYLAPAPTRTISTCTSDITDQLQYFSLSSGSSHCQLVKFGTEDEVYLLCVIRHLNQSGEGLI